MTSFLQSNFNRDILSGNERLGDNYPLLRALTLLTTPTLSHPFPPTTDARGNDRSHAHSLRSDRLAATATVDGLSRTNALGLGSSR